MLYRADFLKSLGRKNLGFQKSAAVEIRNSAETASTSKTYDIFLSHSYADKEVVWGLKSDIESLGHSVYIDWIDDPQMNRLSVTKATAGTLRWRMRQCKTLFFATSTNSSDSIWMPWELGYFDAFSKSRVAICPIVQTDEFDFTGQEYLGLYPYVDRANVLDTSTPALWIHETPRRYVRFTRWMNGEDPADH